MNKTINFQGVDNGVSSMIEKLRNQAAQSARESIQYAQKYSSSGKEQVNIIQQQIEAMKRRNELEAAQAKLEAQNRLTRGMENASPMDQKKAQAAYQQAVSGITQSSGAASMEVKLLQDIIKTIKETAAEEIREDRDQVKRNVSSGEASWFAKKFLGKKDFDGLPEEQRLKLQHQQDALRNDKISGPEQGVFKALIATELIKQFGSVISQLPSIQNENQTIAPMAGLGGSAIGGILGSVIPGLGTVIGAAVGKMVGDGIGEAEQRHLNSKDELNAQVFRNVALSNKDRAYSPEALSAYGLSKAYTAQLAETYARSKGRFGNTGEIENFTALQKGYALNQGILLDAVGNTRFTRDNDLFSNVSKVYGGASQHGAFVGGDTSIFSDLLKNQSSLVKQFSQTAEKVNGDIATKSILEFNKMGGSFSSSDPRSLYRISGINSDISNPGNDFVQAQTYSVLRQLNPNASLFALKKLQEQGIQAPGLLKGLISDIEDRGGSEDHKLLMLKARLPSLSYEAVERLWKNRSDIDSIKSISGGLNQELVRTRGKSATTSTQVSGAEISDAFAEGAIDGVKRAAQAFGDALEKTMKDVTILPKTKMPNGENITYGVDMALQ